MIVVYKKITKKQIVKEGKAAISKITKWFEKNPDRKVCKAEFWYGKMTKVRKNHIKEDIDKAVQLAIGDN